MNRGQFFKKHIHPLCLTAVILMFLSSCLDSGKGGRKLRPNFLGSSENSGLGDGARGDDGGFSGDEGSAFSKVEIRHLVDPFDGTYKTKLAIPRNFTGTFYVSGLNIASLSDRLVSVRFKFGRELEPVTIPAVVGVGPGITGTANISVLILNITDRPFKNIRLLYDLFDYNNYAQTDEPITDNRSNQLYCRGLKLQDDPTFEGVSGSCTASGDKCLYAYAKIRDSSLFDVSGGVPLSNRPKSPAVDLSGNGYDSDSPENKLFKCLPDNGVVKFNGVAPPFSLDTTGVPLFPNPLPGLPVHTVNGLNYHYVGPYLAINVGQWEIGPLAAVHDHLNEADINQKTPRGLFMRQQVMGDLATSYYSYLFPRAGKLSLRAGSRYLASSGDGGPMTRPQSFHVTADRAIEQLINAGETTSYLDGCSIRASNFNEELGEGIGSCNVTANLEVISTDNAGVETVLASTKAVKLQLVRPSLQDNTGKEVLFSSFKSCTSSSTCAANECCFNRRCVEKTIISQCKEDAVNTGNRGIGESCSVDFECNSLCCNAGTNRCAVHDNTLDIPVLCSKAPGQTCVAKEWCRKELVQNCFIVKTGFDSLGRPTCTRRCYQVPTFGDCKNGRCVAAVPPPIPAFDPANPDCTNAIDPPTF